MSVSKYFLSCLNRSQADEDSSHPTSHLLPNTKNNEYESVLGMKPTRKVQSIFDGPLMLATDMKEFDAHQNTLLSASAFRLTWGCEAHHWDTGSCNIVVWVVFCVGMSSLDTQGLALTCQHVIG